MIQFTPQRERTDKQIVTAVLMAIIYLRDTPKNIVTADNLINTLREFTTDETQALAAAMLLSSLLGVEGVSPKENHEKSLCNTHNSVNAIR